MRRQVLLDTGPLVALLNRRDRHHAWAKARFAEIAPPLLTCEAVIAESCHLLRGTPGGGAAVLRLIARGVVEVPFQLAPNAEAVAALMQRYASVPMSLADASLVLIAERSGDCAVLTLDRDFLVYRVGGSGCLPSIMPAAASRRLRGRQ